MPTHPDIIKVGVSQSPSLIRVVIGGPQGPQGESTAEAEGYAIAAAASAGDATAAADVAAASEATASEAAATAESLKEDVIALGESSGSYATLSLATAALGSITEGRGVYVTSDGANNGFYFKRSGVLVRESTATIPALDVSITGEIVARRSMIDNDVTKVRIPGQAIPETVAEIVRDADGRIIAFIDVSSGDHCIVQPDGSFSRLLPEAQSLARPIEKLRAPAMPGGREVLLDADNRSFGGFDGMNHRVMTPSGVKRAAAVGDSNSYDAVIYGGSPAGIMANQRLTEQGYRTLVIEPTPYVGGMIAGGLCWTDNPTEEYNYFVTGRTMAFFEAMATYPHASPASALNSRWALEPKTATSFLRDLLFDSGATVMLNARLDRGDVHVRNNRIESLSVGDRLIRGGFFINASYTGDLGRHAGIPYVYGRESSAQYGESLAGFRPDVAYQLAGYTDLSMVPVYPAGMVKGDADNKTQSYNVRVTGTKSVDRLPWPQPAGYDANSPFLMLFLQTILIKQAATGQPVYLTNVALPGGAAAIFGADPLPNGKYDFNNSLIVGADCVGMNTTYPTGTWSQRDAAEAAMITQLQSVLYFAANDPRVPVATRDDVNSWGLCPDEFIGSPWGDGWSPTIYPRETIRMVGQYVLKQQDQEAGGNTKATRACSWVYNFRDVHGVQYYRDPSDSTKLRLEGNLGSDPDFTPYDIPMECLFPAVGSITNFADCVTISSSHAAYAATRMEPAYMMMGEVTGELAADSLATGRAVQDYNYAKVREALDRYIPLRVTA